MEQTRKILVGTGAAAVILGIASGRLPRWLRLTLFLAAAVLALSAGLFAYRQLTTPRTYTVAVGSLEGDAAQIMSAVAARLASTGSLVRLKVLDKGSIVEATKAFSSGEAKLAIARPDVGDLSAARSVVIVTHAVVLLVVPPGSAIKEIGDLKGKTVGVVGGEANKQLVEVLTREYDLARANVQFQDVAIKEIQSALQAKRVSALLVAMPIADKYLSMLREAFPAKGKTTFNVLAIEAAGAIEAIAKAYESYELPKGTLRGAPPIPDDDLTTLRVAFYLVADKSLDDDVVSDLAKALMEVRRDLVGTQPILSQISAPSTESDAFIPVHPGAKAYFDGDVKTVFDKYGDQFFYGSMLFGGFMSLLAGAWKFLTKDAGAEAALRPVSRVYGLVDKVGQANSEAELAEIEKSVDGIVRTELEQYSSDNNSSDIVALDLATRRAEHAIEERRKAFGAGVATASFATGSRDSARS